MCSGNTQIWHPELIYCKSLPGNHPFRNSYSNIESFPSHRRHLAEMSGNASISTSFVGRWFLTLMPVYKCYLALLLLPSFTPGVFVLEASCPLKEKCSFPYINIGHFLWLSLLPTIYDLTRVHRDLLFVTLPVRACEPTLNILLQNFISFISPSEEGLVLKMRKLSLKWGIHLASQPRLETTCVCMRKSWQEKLKRRKLEYCLKQVKLEWKKP